MGQYYFYSLFNLSKWHIILCCWFVRMDWKQIQSLNICTFYLINFIKHLNFNHIYSRCFGNYLEYRLPANNISIFIQRFDILLTSLGFECTGRYNIQFIIWTKLISIQTNKSVSKSIFFLADRFEPTTTLIKYRYYWRHGQACLLIF